MKTRSGDQPFELLVETPEGAFVASYSAKGLCALNFPRASRERKPASTAMALPTRVLSWHKETTRALHLALAGRTPDSLPPLDLSSGTNFQQSVWQALRRIGFGCTQSYAQVAEAMGKPKAVRAVGGACGANPIPVFVPCHRVLAAHQQLGGFSAGLDWKRTLLAREGIKPIEAKVPVAAAPGRR